MEFWRLGDRVTITGADASTCTHPNRSKMRIKEIILFFVVLLVVSSPASSKPANKNMVSVHVQKNTRDKETIYHSKFSHGSSGGGHGGGGRSNGEGDNVNGGQSQGGGTAAVIPVYAGGAAAAHRNNHRNAATCSHYCIELPSLVAAVLAYMLAHICIVLEF